MFCQPSDCSVVEGRANSPREASRVTRDTRDTALVTKSLLQLNLIIRNLFGSNILVSF